MTSFTPWENRVKDWKACEDADEIEFRALCCGTSAFNEAARDVTTDGSLSDSAGTQINDDPPTTRKKSKPTQIRERREAIILAATEELRRRKNSLGDDWPFRLNSSSLEKLDTGSTAYDFCLATARAPSLVQGEFAQLPRVFELLSATLLGRWLGPSSEFIRTGWPREESLPERFQALFSGISSRFNHEEWCWSPERDLPNDPDPQYLKEGKLDVLAWLETPDGHTGRVFFLGQCAAGKSDLEDKSKELQIASLTKWFHPMTIVPPMRCFFVPFLFPPASLKELQRTGGTIFERNRLAKLAARHGLPEELESNLRRMTALVVNNF